MDEERLFGIHLHQQHVSSSHIAAPREIGSIHGGEFLVIEAEDGSTSVREVATGESVHLNRDRRATEGFLEAFAEYLRSGPASTGPVTFTAEQAAERLQAFRAGRLRPSPRAGTDAGVPHRSRLQALRKTLRSIDREATGGKSWWRHVIEQAEDDLL